MFYTDPVPVSAPPTSTPAPPQAAQAPPTPVKFEAPVWCHDDDKVPVIYKQVLEAATVYVVSLTFYACFGLKKKNCHKFVTQ